MTQHRVPISVCDLLAVVVTYNHRFCIFDSIWMSYLNISSSLC